MLLRHQSRNLGLQDQAFGHAAAAECRTLVAIARERASHDQISFAGRPGNQSPEQRFPTRC